MAGTGDVLMSTRELGCRRTNYQAERYLTKVIGQLDIEKHLVERDWERRMKTLVLQKQKRMPKVWESKNKPSALRARSAWEGRMHKNYVMTRPQSAVGSEHRPSPVPSHWHFLASYTATPDGRRIPNPGSTPGGDSNPTKTNRHLQSARPAAGLKHTSLVKSRRATSAPVRRSGLSTCIITQMPTFTDDLGKIQSEKDEAEDSQVLNSNRSGSSTKRNCLLTTVPSQPESGKLRPQSAVTSVKGNGASTVNRRLSRKKYSSHVDLVESGI